jgi:hypothetical protein
MFGQARGHRWRYQFFSPNARKPGSPSAQLMMGPAEIVRTAKQPHAAFQCFYPPSRMPTFARQVGKALAHRAVQSFNKRRIEYGSSLRRQK